MPEDATSVATLLALKMEKRAMDQKAKKGTNKDSPLEPPERATPASTSILVQ